MTPTRASRPLMLAAATLWLSSLAGYAQSGGSIDYRLSFPEPQHHWMQVEATFTDLPEAPLELRMSRSSPGRYSLHDFAKNVYEVEARDATVRGGHAPGDAVRVQVLHRVHSGGVVGDDNQGAGGTGARHVLDPDDPDAVHQRGVDPHHVPDQPHLDVAPGVVQQRAAEQTEHGQGGQGPHKPQSNRHSPC